MSPSTMFYHFLLLINVSLGVNRLLDSSYNPSNLINTTNIIKRRRLTGVDITSFADDNGYLKGVAAISRLHSDPADVLCSGALIKPSHEEDGYNVLTAAHCLYDRAAEEFEPRASLLVEFGVIDDKPRGGTGIIQCDVSEIIVHDKWPLSDNHMKLSVDFGIAKLTDCNGDVTEDMMFEISDYQSRGTDDFMRAGYGGTRTLRTAIHTRIRKPIEKKTNPGGYADVFIHVGHARPGNSGGPIFDLAGTHNIRAVYNGQPVMSSLHDFTRHRAVIINRKNHQIINNMMKGIDGISSNFLPADTTCQDWRESGLTHTKCWGPCLHEHDEECYSSKWTNRLYFEPQREYGCKKGKTQKLCGSLPKCSDPSAEEYKHCMGTCVATDDVDTDHYCPEGRAHKTGYNNHRDCKRDDGDDGYSYLCYEKMYEMIHECNTRNIREPECWSNCQHKHEFCWTSSSGVRPYVRGRKYCGKIEMKTSRYLCGEFITRNCVGGRRDRPVEIATRKCWGKCKNVRHEEESCPTNRPLAEPRVSNPCRNRGEHRFLCNAEIGAEP